MTGELPLRALHAPPPLPWQGPTPFEWGLGALLLLILGWLVLRLRAHRVRVQWRRELRGELRQLEALASTAPDKATHGCLTLMRRLLLLQGPRENFAALTGQQWLEALDRYSGSQWFTQGEGKALRVAGFARPGDPETVRLALDASRRLVEATLERQPVPPDA